MEDYAKLNQHVRELAEDMRKLRDALIQLSYEPRDNVSMTIWLAYTAEAFDNAASALMKAAANLTVTFHLPIVGLDTLNSGEENKE